LLKFASDISCPLGLIIPERAIDALSKIKLVGIISIKPETIYMILTSME